MDLKVLWTISNSMGTASDINMLKKARGFNIEVVTADLVEKASAGAVVAGKNYIIPSGDKFDYINSIAQICEREGITTIMPQYGHELLPLSRNMDLLEGRGIQVLVSEDTQKLEIANDKKKLYEFFQGKHFVPLHTYASDIDTLEKAIYNLGYPYNPVCIKPLSGEGGRGFRIITDESIDIFNGEDNGTKVGLNVFMAQLLGFKKIPELMVMEYLPGMEYSVDCVSKKGEVYICIPRQRVETSMGVSTVSIIEKNDEIMNMAYGIISELHLSYNTNIQFKYSSDGRPKLVEVNPRVSGSLIANYGAGVNMLEYSLKLAYGLPIEKPQINWGVKMIRYWDQIFV